MNVVFKLMFFSIVLNLATGIMMTAIVDGDGDQIFTQESGNMFGMNYDANYTSSFDRTLAEPDLQPTSLLEDVGNAIYRVLDMITLGFIRRIVDTIYRYIFGFVTLLDNMFGGYLTENTRSFLFGTGGLYPGVFITLLSVGYVVGALKLWTGKDLVEK